MSNQFILYLWMMSKDKFNIIGDWFSKNWRKYINDTNDSKFTLSPDRYDEIIEPIKDMRLSVTPIDEEVNIDGWKYIGPGQINLYVDLDLDYLLDYSIDHHMVARQFLIPWLRGILKYFTIDIYADFVSVNIIFKDNEGLEDNYKSSITEADTYTFYYDKPKYWEYTRDDNY